MARFEALQAFPRTADRTTAPVRLWLLAVAALVFLMVSVGGATRLTGSGLSITEWQPIVGTVPPLSEAAWQEAFAKYKQIPQYERLNRGMSLEAFKGIYWWEWGHRFLGRLVGAAFLLPFLYFLVRGYISRQLLPRLVGLFALGGAQGALGWYMVRSGLADRVDVSQYRLALHLGLAIAIMGALLWVALSLDGRKEPSRRLSRHGWMAAAILALVFLQIELGALVAGLKAGLSHNTWPLMDGRLIPGGLGVMQPWYLNLFENVLTVQFNHRVAGYVLLLAAIWQAWRVIGDGADTGVKRSATILAAAVLAQLGLGIWTLLTQVPLALGLAHQAGAAAVFGLSVWHLHEVQKA